MFLHFVLFSQSLCLIIPFNEAGGLLTQPHLVHKGVAKPSLGNLQLPETLFSNTGFFGLRVWGLKCFFCFHMKGGFNTAIVGGGVTLAVLF